MEKDNVRINKDQLIEVVKKNKEKHENDFKQAQEDYVIALGECIKELRHEYKKDPFNVNVYGIFNELSKPESHVDEYETVLQILSFSVEKEVTITFHQFQNWVQDRWNWSAGFIDNSVTLAGYKNKRRK